MESRVAMFASRSVLPVGLADVKKEPSEADCGTTAKDGFAGGGGGGTSEGAAGGSKQKQKTESQLILVMEPQNPSPTKYFDQNGVLLKKEETAADPEQVKGATKSKRTKLTITCHKCRRMFETKVEFEFHYRKAYNQEPVYACGQCDKQISQYKAYRLHCYRHSNSATQRYTCAVCAKVFHQKSDLTRHEAIHEPALPPTSTQPSENVPITCDRCDAVFSTQAEVRVHVRKIHPVPKQMIECPDCGKFLSAGSLYSHRKIHSVDGPRFRCEDCDKSFVQKINFIHHRKKHLPHDERPFPCQECDKAFFEKSHLQRHQFFHSEVRPFKCESCGKCYKTERCLKVHSAVHTPKSDRPFVCTECHKGFLSSSKLRQHSNIHSGLRPFKCQYCTRDFTNFPNWLKHIRRRHKVDHRTGEKLASVPKFMTKKKTPESSDAPTAEKKPRSKKIKEPPPQLPPPPIKEESLPFVGDNSNIDLNLVSKDDLLPPLKMEEMGDIFLSLPEGVVSEDARDGTSSSPEKEHHRRRTTATAASEEEGEEQDKGDGAREEESLPEPPLGLGVGDDGVLFRFGYGDVVVDEFGVMKDEFAANEAASVIRESEINCAGASNLRSIPPLLVSSTSPDQQQQQPQQQHHFSTATLVDTVDCIRPDPAGLSIFPTLISICGGVGGIGDQPQFQLINPNFLHLPQLLRRNPGTAASVATTSAELTPESVGLRFESP